MPHAPLVALLTDFGLSDPYVGQMHAVLASHAPGLRILDLCHGVPAHDIAAGAFFLAASLPWLPPGSVTCAVVDPGVGGPRRIVGLSSRDRLILAPDNGLLTLVLAHGAADAAWVFPVPDAAAATFHGRDVFAPLAAALACGASAASLGQPVPTGSLQTLSGLTPGRDGPHIRCRVLHADRFGNLVLTLPVTPWLPVLDAAPGLVLSPPGLALRRARTYADIPPGALGLVAGSQGYFELAAHAAPAASLAGLTPGQGVTISLEEPSATRG